MSDQTQLKLVVDGVDFGEGPRWHDDRLWYSRLLPAGDLRGHRGRPPRGRPQRPRRPTVRARLAARRAAARGLDDDRSSCSCTTATASSSTPTCRRWPRGYCNDMVVDHARQRVRRQLRLRPVQGRGAAPGRPDPRPRGRLDRGRRRRAALPERLGDHPGRPDADRRRELRRRLRGVHDPTRRHARGPAPVGRRPRHRRPTAARSTPSGGDLVRRRPRLAASCASSRAARSPTDRDAAAGVRLRPRWRVRQHAVRLVRPGQRPRRGRAARPPARSTPSSVDVPHAGWP